MLKDDNLNLSDIIDKAEKFYLDLEETDLEEGNLKNKRQWIRRQRNGLLR